MKINEIADVTVHPAVKKEQEFVNLLQAGEEAWEEIAEFIMDDRNAESRRLQMLHHLDELQGDVQDAYDASSLEKFMHDQGPSGGWREELRRKLDQVATPEYNWKKGDYDMSDEDMIEIAKDLKIPPYHLSSVEEDEQFDDEISTGEYEICDKCFGEGCPECEEGLVDVTGQFKLPDFGNID